MLLRYSTLQKSYRQNLRSLQALVPFSTSPPRITLSLFRHATGLRCIRLLHGQLLVQSLFFTPPFPSFLISSYISRNSLSTALSLLHLFRPSSLPVFCWNLLIQRSLSLGFPRDATAHFRSLLRRGWSPDEYTFTFLLKAGADVPDVRYGRSAHKVVVTSGFEGNVFVCNAAVAMYGKCGELEDARKVFGGMLRSGVWDLVSWNSIVAASVQCGDCEEAIRSFGRMSLDNVVKGDEVSLVNVLSACAALEDFEKGKEVHCFAARQGLSEDLFVSNALVDMYAKCGRLDDASMVFHRMAVKDVVSWNTMVTGFSQVGRLDEALEIFDKMREGQIKLNVVTWSAVIAGYAQRGCGHEALDVFRDMLLHGSKPNAITLISLLSGCASIGALTQGKETHCYSIKCVLNGQDDRTGDASSVLNALIDMYAKCKSVVFARMMFEAIPPKDRNVVTWTVMIGGYAQHGEANDALKLFSDMVHQDNFMKPNSFTISCGLMACGRLAALRVGRQIHAYILRNQYQSTVLHVENCLIDMYSKSGDIETARAVFDSLRTRNSVSWTSLMTGYGMHGRGEEALWVFQDMRKAGLVPDDVTFVVLLYACSHAGMVDEGVEYFNNMEKDFGVVPRAEHYACMVDLLGRAGRLGEAVKIIKAMKMEPTPVVWVALLSACRLHGNVDFAEYAANKLAEVQSDNDGSYTLLSNIYASAGQWKDVARVRSLMKHTGVRKRPGWSCLQGRKGATTFYAGDRTHPLSDKIYEALAALIRRIKPLGYIPQMSFALHDVDDEEKGDLLSEHSEKLALAYGILISSPGEPIRITKNLRVCGDCHSAMTYASMIFEHEIILRDSSRFHHFKNGTCSCRGYW
ncbi:hypothetical protein MLD38_021660 [Melastoma candidum]|uniref:Uncharacterized protein n=1 Tax=Melastoma candidum TaxID=119954 RepID=A0ACB9QGQ6_9MYRT|nr:hypothetical protein MLD38_021660 [Melastoma candidum]